MTDDVVEVACNLQFPEGPVVLPDGTLAVVEIAAGRVTRCHLDGRTETIAQTGGGPNGAALGPDGALYVCNNGGFAWQRDAAGHLFPHGRSRAWCGGSIQRVDLRDGSVRTLYREAAGRPLSAPNDIVFDADGGFWFTDLGEMGDSHVERGRVCYARIEGDHIREAIRPMLTPNGIALSPDGSRLYVAETLTARLWAFALRSPGEVALQAGSSSAAGHMLYAAPRFCSFDSMAVEAQGNLCIATLGLGGITVVDPHGALVEFVKFPDRSTTNLCFGGALRETAYVTQSRQGRLVARRWPRQGLPAPFN